MLWGGVGEGRLGASTEGVAQCQEALGWRGEPAATGTVRGGRRLEVSSALVISLSQEDRIS
jgi:hypothetical protein